MARREEEVRNFNRSGINLHPESLQLLYSPIPDAWKDSLLFFRPLPQTTVRKQMFLGGRKADLINVEHIEAAEPKLARVRENRRLLCSPRQVPCRPASLGRFGAQNCLWGEGVVVGC